jgi:hypothetical protein
VTKAVRKLLPILIHVSSALIEKKNTTNDHFCYRASNILFAKPDAIYSLIIEEHLRKQWDSVVKTMDTIEQISENTWLQHVVFSPPSYLRHHHIIDDKQHMGQTDI